MSGIKGTPTKPVLRRGRKPEELSASDSCRMCGNCFKTQFSNFKSGWISSENMFVAPNRNGKTLPMLADRLRKLSIDLEEEDVRKALLKEKLGGDVRRAS